MESFAAWYYGPVLPKCYLAVVGHADGSLGWAVGRVDFARATGAALGAGPVKYAGWDGTNAGQSGAVGADDRRPAQLAHLGRVLGAVGAVDAVLLRESDGRAAVLAALGAALREAGRPGAVAGAPVIAAAAAAACTGRHATLWRGDDGVCFDAGALVCAFFESQPRGSPAPAADDPAPAI
jgi:hypothetical protein